MYSLEKHGRKRPEDCGATEVVLMEISKTGSWVLPRSIRHHLPKAFLPSGEDWGVVVLDDRIQQTVTTIIRNMGMTGKERSYLMFLCKVDLRTRSEARNWKTGK